MKKLIIAFFALVFSISFGFSAATIKGKITNKKTGKPLTGVVVNLSADSKSNALCVSDLNGDYEINTEAGTFSLEISYFVNIDSTAPNLVINDGQSIELNFAINPNIYPDTSHRKNVARKGIESSEKLSAGARYTSDESVDALVPASTPVKEYASMEESPIASMGIAPKEDAATGGVYMRAGSVNAGSAGVLTSGEVNDFRKWEMWNDFADKDLNQYKNDWGIFYNGRYSVQLVTSDNKPALDYLVKLMNIKTGEVVWSARSDNTGKVELWANRNDSNKVNPDNLIYGIMLDDKSIIPIREGLTEFSQDINFTSIPAPCQEQKNVDIVFAVDATGSMQDEINYLKAEIKDIIGKLKSQNQALNYRVGSMFYRDTYDEYIIKSCDISSDIDSVSNFINEQEAGGGGDTPEAVELAIEESLNNLSWSKNAVARIMFIILDAPPHQTEQSKKRLYALIKKAAAMGVRIVPVTCSGIDKSGEYLMRSIALGTNGTYVFLTDHSGVGDKHIEPTTDKYDVELLNSMFIRLINQFTVVPSCQVTKGLEQTEFDNSIFNKDESKIDESTDEFKNLLSKIKCYPNPTSGELTIDLTSEVEEMFLTDISGKLLEKIPINGNTSQKILLGGKYPNGVMFLKFSIKGYWGCVKVLLIQ